MDSHHINIQRELKNRNDKANNKKGNAAAATTTASKAAVNNNQAIAINDEENICVENDAEYLAMLQQFREALTM
jgi:hypothetical protein